MRRQLLAIFALAAALANGGPNLMADHGNKGEKHEQGSNHSSDRDDQGWQQRGGYEYHLYGSDDRPPGWSQGKKTGWGNCGLPPGQAKKYGCRTYTYQGRPYYYYEEPDGRMVVRRPTIEVHASVDIVH
ncbi:MAG TPA: hypothetical protein VFB24_15490 [Candidatus Binatia bacterium]|nr:hypothetical protein [Candidatus Binatia bacterium]